MRCLLSIFPFLLGAAAAAQRATEWTFVQNGTSGIVALELITVSPTLMLMFDRADGNPLLLPDGSRVICSRTDNSDLFYATLCGLGATGIVLDITMQVTDKFSLREVQETRPFDDVIDHLDDVVHSSEFVRLWWWPQDRAIRVSAMDRTIEVS